MTLCLTLSSKIYFGLNISSFSFHLSYHSTFEKEIISLLLLFHILLDSTFYLSFKESLLVNYWYLHYSFILGYLMIAINLLIWKRSTFWFLISCQEIGAISILVLTQSYKNYISLSFQFFHGGLSRHFLSDEHQENPFKGIFMTYLYMVIILTL